MTARRIFGGAAVLLLVLTGCNRVTRITTNEVASSMCFSQSLSADGRWIAFSTRPSGSPSDQKTILRDLRSGHNRLLAGPSSGTFTDAAISADGSRVVMTIREQTPDGERSRVYLWTSRSGVRTRISPLDESSTRPIMSSDGRKVIYSDPAGLNLWIYDIGSGSRRLLARPQGVQPTDGLIPVSTSATGRYVVAGGNFAGMFVLDTTTGTSWKLPGIGSQYSVALDISGDGRWVAYTWLGTTDPGGRNLHVWDRTTDQAVKLVDPPEQDGVESVSISSDGTRIAYTVKARRAAVARLETIARSGGSSTFIARSKNGISDVSIAGDGRMGSFCSRGTDLAPDSPAAPNLYTWS